VLTLSVGKESPGNIEHQTPESGDTHEGIVTEKKITALMLAVSAMVRRWGKSPPGLVAIPDAVCLLGCKAMYTGN